MRTNFYLYPKDEIKPQRLCYGSEGCLPPPGHKITLVTNCNGFESEQVRKVYTVVDVQWFAFVGPAPGVMRAKDSCVMEIDVYLKEDPQ